MPLKQLIATAALLVHCTHAAERTVSWWMEIGNNATTDANNLKALKALNPAAVTRVMPDFDAVKGDKGDTTWNLGVGTMYGDIYVWWHYEKEVNEWLKPLKELGSTKILPWAIYMSNATCMHDKVYPNATKFIADAVAIAEHYGFDGWHIDYEDERPPDNFPHASDDLHRFLKQFSDALHAKGMQLVMDVAGWSHLISNFTNIASAGVDELQDMSFYDSGTDSPSTQKSDLAEYFAKVRAGAPKDWATKAGVGIGVYYDGRNGYAQHWNETSARDFVAEVVRQGGGALDIFRLNMDAAGKYHWPYADWWWGIIEDFAMFR